MKSSYNHRDFIERLLLGNAYFCEEKIEVTQCSSEEALSLEFSMQLDLREVAFTGACSTRIN